MDRLDSRDIGFALADRLGRQKLLFDAVLPGALIECTQARYFLIAVATISLPRSS